MRNKFRERLHNDKLFTRILTSLFFKDIFQQNFKVSKSVFMKYVVSIRLYSFSFFNNKNVAVYILVQLKEYYLIWKVRPLTVPTDIGNW